MRWSAARIALTLVVALAMLATACTAADVPAETAPSSTSEARQAAPAPAPAPTLPAEPPAPLPEPPPNAPEPPELSEDITAEDLFDLGVILEDGFSPHEHLGRTNGMLNWPPDDLMPQGIGDAPVPDGLGPLAIEARIERFPISCLEWTRTIGAVDVGDGDAARRIAEALVETSAEENARFSGWFGVEEDCDDLDPRSLTSRGDAYHELREQPCELPDGPDVRCFVLAAFGYPPGAAHTYLRHHQLVFDTATGERLGLDALFAAGGVDPDVGFVVTDLVVRRITGMPTVTIRQARPTAEGLVFGFSPYEAGSWVEYTRDVTIPWGVYRMVGSTPA